MTRLAGLSSNDSNNWNTLGASFTTFASLINTATTGGLAFTVTNLANEFERRDQDSGWSGNFASGQALLWNRLGTNGPMVINPTSLIAGAGFQIQADFFGFFTGQIDVFGLGNTLLSSVSLNGNSTADGDDSAIFLGFLSPSVNVDRFEISIAGNPGAPGDFAISNINFNTRGGVNITPVSEPSAYALFGAPALVGLMARRLTRAKA